MSKVHKQIQGKRAQQFSLVSFYVLMVRRNELSPILFEVQFTKAVVTAETVDFILMKYCVDTVPLKNKEKSCRN